MTREIILKDLVKRGRRTRSQRRGSGFESRHLHLLKVVVTGLEVEAP